MLLASLGSRWHRNTTWKHWKLIALVALLLVCIWLVQLPRFFRISPLRQYEAPSTKARYLSPAELMDRPLAPALHAIPKLFHQSWSTTTLPKKFTTWSDRCRELHPDWEWVLWTDDDNARLFERFLPWLVESFNSLPGPIYRADLSRNAYMLLFGGVYADLDTDCLLPVEQNILSEYKVPTIAHGEASEASTSDRGNRSAFLGRMGTDDKFPHSIPNAWMASPPSHPFFHLVLEWAREHTEKGILGSPEDVTGPVALRNGVLEYTKSEYHPKHENEAVDSGVNAALLQPTNQTESYSEARAQTLRHVTFTRPHDVVVLPFHHIYPYSWDRDGGFVRDVCWSAVDTFNETRCKELLAVDRWPSTTITYWSHSWNSDGHNTGNLDKISV